MEFETGENVLIKVSPVKVAMRFSKNINKVRDILVPLRFLNVQLVSVVHNLALPPNLFGVHPVFHVSMLIRYHGDNQYIIKWDSIVIDKDLQCEEEPISILDHDMCKLSTKDINFVNVQWKHHPVEKTTWEIEKDIETSILNCLSIQVLLLSFLRLLLVSFVSMG